MTRGGRILFDQLLPFAVGALLVLVLVSAILALGPGGDGTAVLVAKSDQEGGKPLDPADTKIVSVPPSAVPDGALTAPAELAGLVALRTLPRGTVLTRADLASEADLLPAGKAAVQLELENGILGVESGDSVQIWGPPDACMVAEGGIELLDSSARVQSVSAEDASLLSGETASVVVLGVSQRAVPDVLCAATSGRIHLVRTSG